MRYKIAYRESPGDSENLNTLKKGRPDFGTAVTDAYEGQSKALEECEKECDEALSLCVGSLQLFSEKQATMSFDSDRSLTAFLGTCTARMRSLLAWSVDTIWAVPTDSSDLSKYNPESEERHSMRLALQQGPQQGAQDSKPDVIQNPPGTLKAGATASMATAKLSEKPEEDDTKLAQSAEKVQIEKTEEQVELKPEEKEEEKDEAAEKKEEQEGEAAKGSLKRSAEDSEDATSGKKMVKGGSQ